MATALHQKFLEKSHAAMLAAIEVYNKPTFSYREETFCILAVNAWELLLKAKMLKEAKNDPKVIQVRVPRQLAGGIKSTKQKTVKKNRAGNAMTLQLSACVNALEKSQDRTGHVPPEVALNLEALIDIRDNATHFIIASALLQRNVLELACASVRNYVVLSKRWFDRDFASSLSLMLPVAFFHGADEVGAVVVTRDEKRLIDRLQATATQSAAESEYKVAVRVEVRFLRSNLDTAAQVRVTADPEALAVRLDERQIMERFPWSYAELQKQLKRHKPDIKFNKEFHRIKKPFMSDKTLVHSRLLDPANPKSSKKDFYNPNIRARILDAYADQEL
ncbi:hypothetical protein FHY12_003279 [Xanthomonas arboricola]|uniref:DUF3644 domain-containing protein n=1 Tax=Xanthomonas euroxanthea TaxID=2259622 RepID=UPI00141AC06B|nr:DUF3644 domain-containing protein [Xanthomonas euroxanthea]NIK40954.1 hypothetical protein [Xanthomonas euroxanthea]